jgi:ATP-grasp domain
VQAMAPPGVDLRVHTTVDDEAGPLVSVGIGGIDADLLGVDEPVRLAPLSEHGATSLVAESQAGHALAQAGIDPSAFVDLLIRCAQLASDYAEIASLDLNPVITTAAGCAVTDAVVTVAPVTHDLRALRKL